MNNEFSKYTSALAVLTSLFFMWGFITCLNDITISHLKSMSELNYAKVMLIQFSFFMACFIVSLSSGITLLQVAANPYITILGKPENASSRLSLAQTVNSMGHMIAPIFCFVDLLYVHFILWNQRAYSRI